MFKSYFKLLFADKREKQPSEAGNPVKVKYKLHIDEKTGIKDIVPSGKINLQEEIDSFKDSCDINVILQKFMAGDVSVLQQKNGFYGDMTLIPESIHELNDKLLNGQQFFDSLPLEEREKFNHSYTQFFTSIGSESFANWFNEFYGDPSEKSPTVHAEVDSQKVSQKDSQKEPQKGDVENE